MTDLRSLEARLEQDDARSVPSTGMKRRMDVEAGAAYRDEIERLRAENERLKKGLREIRQLLEPPTPPRQPPPKMFPTIGLL